MIYVPLLQAREGRKLFWKSAGAFNFSIKGGKSVGPEKCRELDSGGILPIRSHVATNTNAHMTYELYPVTRSQKLYDGIREMPVVREQKEGAVRMEPIRRLYPMLM